MPKWEQLRVPIAKASQTNCHEIAGVIKFDLEKNGECWKVETITWLGLLASTHCGVTWIELTLSLVGCEVNTECESHNHGPKTEVPHWGPCAVILHNCINYRGTQGLQPQPLWLKIDPSDNLLLQKRKTLNFDHIHAGEPWERGKNPWSRDQPLGGGEECWVISSKIAEFWY